MWIYDLTNHLTVELDTVIVLVIMTCIVETKLYKLHPMDKCVLKDFTKYICLAKSILTIFFT